MEGGPRVGDICLTGAGSEQDVRVLWNYIRTPHKCVGRHDGTNQGGIDPGGKTPDPRLETEGRQIYPGLWSDVKPIDGLTSIFFLLAWPRTLWVLTENVNVPDQLHELSSSGSQGDQRLSMSSLPRCRLCVNAVENGRLGESSDRWDRPLVSGIHIHTSTSTYRSKREVVNRFSSPLRGTPQNERQGTPRTPIEISRAPLSRE